MQELQKVLDWIYEHIQLEDRDNVSHSFRRVELTWPGDSKVVIANYTALDFVFTPDEDDDREAVEMEVNADSLLQFPRNAMWVVFDMGHHMGVKVNFEDWEIKAAPVTINPVGTKWEAQGANAYMPIHPSVRPGDTFTDARGLFLCVKRISAFLGIPYNVWVKQT